MLTDDVLHYIDRSVLCWLATVDATGAPNVSPKEVFCAYGASTLLVANIAFSILPRLTGWLATACLLTLAPALSGDQPTANWFGVVPVQRGQRFCR